MNSEKSKTSDRHRLNLTDKTTLSKSENMLLYQTLPFTTHGKIQKNHKKIINLKYQPQNGMKNLNYLMDHILYQIFKIFFVYILKNLRQLQKILQ